MTVVVTGAAGFVGRSLVPALAARGHRIVGIDRRAGIPEPALAVRADLSGADAAADDALRSADAVFHLAARPGVRNDGPDAERLRARDNVDATRRVVETVPLSVPLVVTSSSSVYGGSLAAASRETDALRPRGGYARSKVDVERLCARRVSRGGLVAVARPFTVVGEGQRPDMAVARWLAAARAGLPLPVLGGLERSRDLTDVRDVVEGLARLAERGVRSTVNLGTGRGVALRTLAAAVCGAVGRDFDEVRDVVVSAAGCEEPPATLADTARCQALLGFVPRTDLESVVRRQAAAGKRRPSPGAQLAPA